MTHAERNAAIAKHLKWESFEDGYHWWPHPLVEGGWVMGERRRFGQSHAFIPVAVPGIETAKSPDQAAAFALNRLNEVRA